jgi:glutaredoxin
MDQREVVLYTRSSSLRCWRAKRLLRRSGYQFVVVDTTDHAEVHPWLLEATRHEVVLPYVFIDHRPVGDFGVIRSLYHWGGLAHLLRDDL